MTTTGTLAITGSYTLGRLEGSNPKEIMKFLIQACDYK